jgi:hypothetical protein
MSSAETFFSKLNLDWNAEPNSPMPQVEVKGTDVALRFYLNSFIYPQFHEAQMGVLNFNDCFRYRLGSTNDEGWYRGQCRFTGIAPAWGEFYEVSGDRRLDKCPDDWIFVGKECVGQKHFLFYLRDETFEIQAKSWSFRALAD